MAKTTATRRTAAIQKVKGESNFGDPAGSFAVEEYVCLNTLGSFIRMSDIVRTGRETEQRVRLKGMSVVRDTWRRDPYQQLVPHSSVREPRTTRMSGDGTRRFRLGV